MQIGDLIRSGRDPKRWALLVISTIVLVWALVALARLPALQTYDFAQYWSAGKLLIAGRNPYSRSDLLKVQEALNGPMTKPVVPLSPPWALTFMAPLALFEPHLSRLLWLLATSVMVGLSIQGTWHLYGGGPLGPRLRWIVGFLFAPTMMVLLLAQMGPLVLIALTAFLVYQGRRRDFLAGLLLMPAAVKPHICYLFWIALLLWICRQRRWAVVGGLIVGGLICTSIAVFLDPAVFSQYREVLTDQNVAHRVYPVLTGVVELAVHSQKPWFNLLAPLIGFAWLASYWWRHRTAWEWTRHIPLLLLISLLTSPYAWFFDCVVLLPAVIQCTILLLETRVAGFLFTAAFIASNLVVLVFVGLNLPAFWYVWVVPFWLVLYLLLTRAARQVGPPATGLVTTQPS